ncbi:GNAT family N-acetyltransferase [Erythrobacter crassostreae]|uniref:GNAT family N-acetyltransferase n=1 Tax=Erythrobacter crassostreae TaxID=2828328 RepID=A0A9X1JJL0_9SPHN|nr:GNAT family N-acetyltransferase [Erythrobacter crassostrea]MBV7257981.1 GNAT family N-acetyltransferase [Erythrobacter crassostrea]
METKHVIETVTRQSSRIASTLAQAFQGDPAFSWIVTDPDARRPMLPRFFKLMAEQSLRHGTVLASGQRHAAALIYPAGEVKDDRLWDTIRLLSMFKTALPRGLKVAEAMHARHPHPQPYLYLRYVGVAPQAQGKGWGGALVRAVIASAAEVGQGVLLETATPSNVAIYSRLGFQIDSEWEVPGGGPKFWTMIHPAA